MTSLELLAPAGAPEAGYAALEYGADAVYLGLPRFSARGGATNFSTNDLRTFTNYAHQLDRRRSVYVAVNTLIQDREIPKLVDNLVMLNEIGADAVIVQDLGVARLVREHFPSLQMHASTQMVIHSRAGAEAAREYGITRAVLARELTINEITDISDIDGLETEVFIHGALCYGYSGLCLMSSHFRHLSGNRGKCSYTCRDAFKTGPNAANGFVLSMKDLALPDHLDALKAAGVASLKIEGRKKSSTYVAAVTHYYRQLLDGTLAEEERQSLESDIRTIFSRPQTELFASSSSGKGGVRSTSVKTHQGALVGPVTGFVKGRNEADRVVVQLTERMLEKHDGLQVDIPGEPVTFGFPAKTIWANNRYQQGPPLLRATMGDVVELELPPQHPRIPMGTDVYCSLAGTVKTRFKTTVPRLDAFMGHIPVDIRVSVTADALSATVSATIHGSTFNVDAEVALTDELEVARRDLSDSARRAFEKLGGTPFTLQTFVLANPKNLYVPQALFNGLRREVLACAEEALIDQRQQRRERICSTPEEQSMSSDTLDERWTIAMDNPTYLDAFADDDLSEISEILLDITALDTEAVKTFFSRHSNNCSVRLALPAVTRASEEPQLLKKIAQLTEAGVTRWAISNLSGMTYFKDNWDALDIMADWPLYVLNAVAGNDLFAHGFSGITLSPEDTGENLKRLLQQHPRATVLIYQDTPLAISEACVMATETCRKEACGFRETKLVSQRDSMLAINHNCRTTLINEVPYSLHEYLGDLRDSGACQFRADFIWRDYTPGTVHRIWQELRSGTYTGSAHSGSYGKRI